MPAVKFTAETLKEMNAPTDSGQLEYHWDTVVSGFGLRCAAKTTRRSWVAWGDVIRDGRKIRSRTITFADFDAMSLRDARNRAREILAGMSIGIDPKEAPPEQLDRTLGAALDNLLNAVPQKRSQGTLDGYRYTLGKTLADWMDKPLCEITPQMVKKRNAEIPGMKPTKRGKDGASSANGTWQKFNKLWKMHKRSWNLPENPTWILKEEELQYEEVERERVLSPEEIGTFLNFCEDHAGWTCSDYLLMLLLTGRRASEIRYLKWSEVNLQRAEIHLSRERTKTRKGLHLPLPRQAIEILMRHRANSSEYVFASKRTNEAFAPQRWVLSNLFTDITFHDLRRTFSSIAGEILTEPVRKTLMNHIGQDVTMKRYTFLRADPLRDGAQDVADLIYSFRPAEAVKRVG